MTKYAFPSKHGAGVTEQIHHDGMTLRDYFATAAMASLCRPETASVLLEVGVDGLAKCAYEIADAMLKESDK